jgi:hypothetical protein
MLESAAREGNFDAALALALAEVSPSAVEPVAQRQLDSAVAPRVHEPGRVGFGTVLPQTAALATVLEEGSRIQLAEAMVEFAKDEHEPAVNRQDALIAIAVLAHALPDATATALFPEVHRFAAGLAPESVVGVVPGSDDPLNRFRISFGSTSLTAPGIRAAAALARSPEEYETIQRQAAVLMGSVADESTANAVAAALASLPASVMLPNLEFLAGNPNPWLRALAAVVWAQSDQAPAGIGVRLARDGSPHVRRALAGHLSNEERHADVRTILEGDPRRSLRRQAAKNQP